MKHKEYFLPYAAEINNFLAHFFKEKQERSRKITSLAQDLWKKLEGFLEGGKRIRGGLVRLGYESAGGKDYKKIIPASASIELLHASLLIHDDIIDQDKIRHGRPTVHKLYEAYHKKHYKQGSALHYGESMGIMVGDIGLYEAISLITNTDLPDERKVKAVLGLIDTTVNTAYGEGLDVDLAYRHTKNEKDILTVYKLKTAFYTLVGPLQVGAILAGAKDGYLAQIPKYGLPLGIAFQIQDDILGIFGSEEKTGKSTAADIKEGKNTLLYTQTLKRIKGKTRQQFEKLWGNKGISNKEIEEAREYIKDSGALESSSKKAQELANQAISVIPELTKDKSLQEVYKSLAIYIIEREN